MTDLKHVRNIHNGVADMFLFDEIGRSQGKGIDGQEFANELQLLIDFHGAKEINVLINSPGGNVLDGLSIFNAIHFSPVPVNTIVAGLAASTAGFIVMAGHKRKMNDFGRLMIHGLLQVDEDGNQEMFLTESDKVALVQMRDMIAKVFENNSKKTFNDMVAIMARESWINAELALSLGLIDEIIDTKRQGIKFNDSKLVETSVTNVYNQYKEVLPVPEKTEIPEPKPKIRKMEKVANHLKLNSDASQENVLEAVKTIENSVITLEGDNTQKQTDLDTANARITELEAEIATGKEASIEANDTAATEYVTNKISEGVLKESDKVAHIAKAKNDLKGFKELVDSINTSGASISNAISEAEKVAGKAATEGKTLRELEKSSPKLVANMLKNDIAQYKELYKAQYGKEYNG